MPTFKTMPNYRRYYIPNHSVFLTIVTFDRANWLGNDQHINMLLQAMRWAKNQYSFKHIAQVILPDHLHWMLIPIDKTNFSDLVGAVKRNVTWRLKESGK